MSSAELPGGPATASLPTAPSTCRYPRPPPTLPARLSPPRHLRAGLFAPRRARAARSTAELRFPSPPSRLTRPWRRCATGPTNATTSSGGGRRKRRWESSGLRGLGGRCGHRGGWQDEEREARLRAGGRPPDGAARPRLRLRVAGRAAVAAAGEVAGSLGQAAVACALGAALKPY